jgi:hypothetical protein
VGGVSAYSTLGWFSDPLISTFINYPDAELARLIFHELAHQMSYVPGDSRFNESFASAVEEEGVELWLERFGNPAMREGFARYTVRRKDFLALLLKYRKELERTYAAIVPPTKQAHRQGAPVHRAEGGIPGPESQLGRLCRLRPLLCRAALERPPGLDRDLYRLRAGLPRHAARREEFRRVLPQGEPPGETGQDRARTHALRMIDVGAAPATFMVQRTNGAMPCRRVTVPIVPKALAYAGAAR